MSHARTQIRNALVALLTGLATTGDKVFANRVTPLSEKELPGLRIYVDEEEITAATVHSPAMLQRRVTARVECKSALVDGIDDDLDQIALEVEHAVAGDPTLGGIINGMLVPSAIDVSRSGEGAVPVGTLTITFVAEYEVDNDAVATPL